jgi:hypothetical protein
MIVWIFFMKKYIRILSESDSEKKNMAMMHPGRKLALFALFVLPVSGFLNPATFHVLPAKNAPKVGLLSSI